MTLLPYITDDTALLRPFRGRVWNFDSYGDVRIPWELSRGIWDIPAYFRNLDTNLYNTEGTVNLDKDAFQLNLDVQHFKPEEIVVKTSSDNTVTIEAKHEEQEDIHGQIYRHFVRKYTLPNGWDVNKLESKLSSDGVLTLTAPKEDDDKLGERNVPILKTNEPIKFVNNKSGKNKGKWFKW